MNIYSMWSTWLTIVSEAFSSGIVGAISYQVVFTLASKALHDISILAAWIGPAAFAFARGSYVLGFALSSAFASAKEQVLIVVIIEVSNVGRDTLSGQAFSFPLSLTSAFGEGVVDSFAEEATHIADWLPHELAPSAFGVTCCPEQFLFNF